MTIRSGTTTILMALVLLGCKRAQPATASGTGDAAAISPAASGNASGSSDNATRIVYITDPTLNNMRVMPIKIPASWSFKGVLLPKLPCTNDISEVFRATSPDGHSFSEVMPRLGWKWGNLPGGSGSSENCLPLPGPMSAQDFLKAYSTTMQVEYVSDEPSPGQKGPVQTPIGVWTSAMANVRYRSGSVSMKGLMFVGLTCTHAPTGGGRCSAVVSYLTAPENQFAAVRQLWSAPGMGRQKEMDEWVAAYSQRYAHQVEASTSQFINESNAAFQARQAGYKAAAEVHFVRICGPVPTDRWPTPRRSPTAITVRPRTWSTIHSTVRPFSTPALDSSGRCPIRLRPVARSRRCTPTARPIDAR
jgi:hypothetical protein